MIAADINGDDNVSGIDVVELRKVILGVQDEFTQNTSWRFVDATQEFADASDPFPVDETRFISELASDMMTENFVAVKIGDVNATAANSVAGVDSEVRSNTTMTFAMEDRAVIAGEQVAISLSSTDFKAVSGYQMTVEFNGLTFNDVTSNAITIGAKNVGVISDNVITMSWNSNSAITSTEDLFTIVATATRAGNISEMIKVSDRVIRAEVYVGDNYKVQTVELGIRTEKGVALAINELLQNEPNPFMETTVIGFTLANAGDATITIRDIAGKVIRVIADTYESGANSITLKRDELNATGVLYYTIESEDFSKTMKMIVID